MRKSDALLAKASLYPAGASRHIANLEAINQLALELQQDAQVLDSIEEHLNETVFDRQEERH